MTRILDLGWIGFPFAVGNNEDWRDTSYQYLDGAGLPIPFDGIALQFMMRRSALDAVRFVTASTTGLIDGLSTTGQIIAAPGEWSIVVPRSAMLKVPAGSYVWEIQAFAEVIRTIGSGAVTVTEGIVR